MPETLDLPAVDADLLAHAGIESRATVTVAGALDHIELWDTERWSRQDELGREQMGDMPL